MHLLGLVVLSKRYSQSYIYLDLMDLMKLLIIGGQVIKINNYQKRFSDIIISKLNNTQKITIFGWSFKKNTNDIKDLQQYMLLII